MLGINTDAYQPIERRYRITREVLELLAETRHPVSFVTREGAAFYSWSVVPPCRLRP